MQKKVGILPTDISGPRLVLNLRVPPKPKNLTARDDLFGMLPGGGAAGHRKHHCGGGNSSSAVGVEDEDNVGAAGGGEFEEEEAEYDETLERWQYVKVSIKGVE